MPLATREIELVLIARDRASATLARVGGALSILGAGLTGIGALGVREFVDMTHEAAEFRQGAVLAFTQVDNVANATLESIEQASLRVYRNTGRQLEEVQGGFFDLFSTIDVSNMVEAEAIVNAFAESALVGKAPIEDIGRTTIAWLNALNQPATIDNVNRLLNIQFELVRKGAGSYEEIAANIGKAIPAFTAAEQTVESFSGVFAFLTRNGLNAAQASTSAARAIELLFSRKGIEGLKKYGIAVSDAEGKTRKMSDVIRDMLYLFRNTDGSLRSIEDRKNVFYDIFGTGRIQARRFFDVAIPNFEEFVNLIELMENTGEIDQTASFSFLLSDPADPETGLGGTFDTYKQAIERLSPKFEEFNNSTLDVGGSLLFLKSLGYDTADSITALEDALEATYSNNVQSNLRDLGINLTDITGNNINLLQVLSRIKPQFDEFTSAGTQLQFLRSIFGQLGEEAEKFLFLALKNFDRLGSSIEEIDRNSLNLAESTQLYMEQPLTIIEKMVAEYRSLRLDIGLRLFHVLEQLFPVVKELTGIWYDLSDAERNHIVQVSLLATGFALLSGAALTSLGILVLFFGLLKTFTGPMALIGLGIYGIIKAFSGLTPKITKNWDALAARSSEAWDEVLESFRRGDYNVQSVLLNFFKDILSILGSETGVVQSRLISIYTDWITPIGNIFVERWRNAIANWRILIGETIPGLGEKYFGEWYENNIDGIKEFSQKYEKELIAFGGVIGAALALILGGPKTKILSAGLIIAEFEIVKDYLQSWWHDSDFDFNIESSPLAEFQSNWFNEFKSEWQTKWDSEIQPAIQDIIDSLRTYLDEEGIGYIINQLTEIQSTGLNVLEEFIDLIANVLRVVSGLLLGFVNIDTGKIQTIEEFGNEDWEALVDRVTEPIIVLLGLVRGILTSINAALEFDPEKLKIGTNDIDEALAQIGPVIVSTIFSIIRAVIHGVIAAFTSEGDSLQSKFLSAMGDELERQMAMTLNMFPGVDLDVPPPGPDTIPSRTVSGRDFAVSPPTEPTSSIYSAPPSPVEEDKGFFSFENFLGDSGTLRSLGGAATIAGGIAALVPSVRKIVLGAVGRIGIGALLGGFFAGITDGGFDAADGAKIGAVLAAVIETIRFLVKLRRGSIRGLFLSSSGKTPRTSSPPPPPPPPASTIPKSILTPTPTPTPSVSIPTSVVTPQSSIDELRRERSISSGISIRALEEAEIAEQKIRSSIVLARQQAVDAFFVEQIELGKSVPEAVKAVENFADTLIITANDIYKAKEAAKSSVVTKSSVAASDIAAIEGSAILSPKFTEPPEVRFPEHYTQPFEPVGIEKPVKMSDGLIIDEESINKALATLVDTETKLYGYDPSVSQLTMGTTGQFLPLPYDPIQYPIPDIRDIYPDTMIPAGRSPERLGLPAPNFNMEGSSLLQILNKANAEQLATLQGIGPKIASSIIEARADTTFKSLDDLMAVPGIGEATINKLRTGYLSTPSSQPRKREIIPAEVPNLADSIIPGELYPSRPPPQYEVTDLSVFDEMQAREGERRWGGYDPYEFASISEMESKIVNFDNAILPEYQQFLDDTADFNVEELPQGARYKISKSKMKDVKQSTQFQELVSRYREIENQVRELEDLDSSSSAIDDMLYDLIEEHMMVERQIEDLKKQARYLTQPRPVKPRELGPVLRPLHQLPSIPNVSEKLIQDRFDAWVKYIDTVFEEILEMDHAFEITSESLLVSQTASGDPLPASINKMVNDAFLAQEQFIQGMHSALPSNLREIYSTNVIDPAIAQQVLDDLQSGIGASSMETPQYIPEGITHPKTLSDVIPGHTDPSADSLAHLRNASGAIPMEDNPMSPFMGTKITTPGETTLYRGGGSEIGNWWTPDYTAANMYAAGKAFWSQDAPENPHLWKATLPSQQAQEFVSHEPFIDYSIADSAPAPVNYIEAGPTSERLPFYDMYYITEPEQVLTDIEKTPHMRGSIDKLMRQPRHEGDFSKLGEWHQALKDLIRDNSAISTKELSTVLFKFTDNLNNMSIPLRKMDKDILGEINEMVKLLGKIRDRRFISETTPKSSKDISVYRGQPSSYNELGNWWTPDISVARRFASPELDSGNLYEATLPPQEITEFQSYRTFETATNLDPRGILSYFGDYAGQHEPQYYIPDPTTQLKDITSIEDILEPVNIPEVILDLADDNSIHFSEMAISDIANDIMGGVKYNTDDLNSFLKKVFKQYITAYTDYSNAPYTEESDFIYSGLDELENALNELKNQLGFENQLTSLDIDFSSLPKVDDLTYPSDLPGSSTKTKIIDTDSLNSLRKSISDFTLNIIMGTESNISNINSFLKKVFQQYTVGIRDYLSSNNMEDSYSLYSDLRGLEAELELLRVELELEDLLDFVDVDFSSLPKVENLPYLPGSLPGKSIEPEIIDLTDNIIDVPPPTPALPSPAVSETVSSVDNLRAKAEPVIDDLGYGDDIIDIGGTAEDFTTIIDVDPVARARKILGPALAGLGVTADVIDYVLIYMQDYQQNIQDLKDQGIEPSDLSWFEQFLLDERTSVEAFGTLFDETVKFFGTSVPQFFNLVEPEHTGQEDLFGIDISDVNNWFKNAIDTMTGGLATDIIDLPFRIDQASEQIGFSLYGEDPSGIDLETAGIGIFGSSIFEAEADANVTIDILPYINDAQFAQAWYQYQMELDEKLDTIIVAEITVIPDIQETAVNWAANIYGAGSSTLAGGDFNQPDPQNLVVAQSIFGTGTGTILPNPNQEEGLGKAIGMYGTSGVDLYDIESLADRRKAQEYLATKISDPIVEASDGIIDAINNQIFPSFGGGSPGTPATEEVGWEVVFKSFDEEIPEDFDQGLSALPSGRSGYGGIGTPPIDIPIPGQPDPNVTGIIDTDEYNEAVDDLLGIGQIPEGVSFEQYASTVYGMYGYSTSASPRRDPPPRKRPSPIGQIPEGVSSEQYATALYGQKETTPVPTSVYGYGGVGGFGIGMGGVGGSPSYIDSLRKNIDLLGIDIKKADRELSPAANDMARQATNAFEEMYYGTVDPTKAIGVEIPGQWEDIERELFDIWSDIGVGFEDFSVNISGGDIIIDEPIIIEPSMSSASREAQELGDNFNNYVNELKEGFDPSSNISGGRITINPPIVIKPSISSASRKAQELGNNFNNYVNKLKEGFDPNSNRNISGGNINVDNPSIIISISSASRKSQELGNNFNNYVNELKAGFDPNSNRNIPGGRITVRNPVVIKPSISSAARKVQELGGNFNNYVNTLREGFDPNARISGGRIVINPPIVIKPSISSAARKVQELGGNFNNYVNTLREGFDPNARISGGRIVINPPIVIKPSISSAARKVQELGNNFNNYVNELKAGFDPNARISGGRIVISPPSVIEPSISSASRKAQEVGKNFNNYVNTIKRSVRDQTISNVITVVTKINYVTHTTGTPHGNDPPGTSTPEETPKETPNPRWYRSYSNSEVLKLSESTWADIFKKTARGGGRPDIWGVKGTSFTFESQDVVRLIKLAFSALKSRYIPKAFSGAHVLSEGLVKVHRGEGILPAAAQLSRQYRNRENVKQEYRNTDYSHMLRPQQLIINIEKIESNADPNEIGQEIAFELRTL